MAEKVTFRISSAAAPYVGADKPREERLKAAAGRVSLPPVDFVVLVYYLCHDTDPEVKKTAMATMRGLDVAFISDLLDNGELHPRILDALVQLHGKNPRLTHLFAAHPMLSEQAARFLAQKRAPGVAPPDAGTARAAGAEADEADEADADSGAGEPKDVAADAEDVPVDDSAEEYLSKYQMSQTMGVGDKIKMALTGDKEWRTILIKDANKLVSGAVVKNPRITENEVLAIAKSAVQNDEIMRVICANKEWVKNVSIRKALVTNHKTPLVQALRFISSLSEKELSLLAKSKNVNTVIASQARRILMTKKEGR